MSEPTFAALYRRFLALVAQPRPLAGAAAERALSDPGAAPLAGWIAAADEEHAASRLGIYAHMYFARLAESLREDYAACAAVIGAPFERVAARYLVAHPSDNPSLRYHGRHFASFLRERAEELAAGAEALRPDLGDLAALEWARIDVFDAPDVALIEPAELAALAPDVLAGLELRLTPAQRLLATRHDVQALWLAAERGDPLPDPVSSPCRLLVWRRGFEVLHRALADDEAEALALLANGASLAELSAVLGSGRSTEAAAARIFGLLGQWLVDELLDAGTLPAGVSLANRAA